MPKIEKISDPAFWFRFVPICAWFRHFHAGLANQSTRFDLHAWFWFARGFDYDAWFWFACNLHASTLPCFEASKQINASTLPCFQAPKQINVATLPCFQVFKQISAATLDIFKFSSKSALQRFHVLKFLSKSALQPSIFLSFDANQRCYACVCAKNNNKLLILPIVFLISLCVGMTTVWIVFNLNCWFVIQFFLLQETLNFSRVLMPWPWYSPVQGRRIRVRALIYVH